MRRLSFFGIWAAGLGMTALWGIGARAVPQEPGTSRPGFVPPDTEAPLPGANLLTLNEALEPISLSENLEYMVRAANLRNSGLPLLPKPSDAYVECGQLIELKATHLCVFNYAYFMNLILGRPSRFVEKDGIVSSHDEHINSPLVFQTEGHNLRSADLARYRHAYLQEVGRFVVPEGEVERAYLKLEDEFWRRYLRPKVQSDPSSIFLAVAVDTALPHTLSHEILHAQFAQSLPYRSAVLSFWENEVAADDKAQIRERLSKNYNVDDPWIVADEFQAYTLMLGADERTLGPYVAKYRDALTGYLRQRHLAPVALPDATASPTESALEAR